jgi:hypothetical protein
MRSASKNQLEAIGKSLPANAWKLIEVTDTHRVWEAILDSEGKTKIRKREMIGDEELQKINRHLYETSSTFSKREVGAIGTPVANIPLSMVYSPQTNIAQKIREGDRDHLRWWLSREENLPFRTQKGKL